MGHITIIRVHPTRESENEDNHLIVT